MLKLMTERAHLMCPNMFFGIQFKIDQAFIGAKFEDSLRNLSRIHPTTLMNVTFDKDNNAFLTATDKSILDFTLTSSLDYKKIFNNISKSSWNTTKESLLRIYVCCNDNSFSVLFVTHHILCDGRGLLTLVKDFANLYAKSKLSDAPRKAIIPILIGDDNKLPKESALPFVSKVITKDANKRFTKENHKVNYEDYLKFEKEFGNKNLISYSDDKHTTDYTKKIISLCKENAISVNDYLVAKMMQEENNGELLIASDIRSKLSNYVPDSVGNFATAYTIKVKKVDSDIIKLAKNINATNKKIASTPSKEMLVLSFYMLLDKELLDAIAISTLGSFKSESGNFVGSNMFGYKSRSNISITNLGKFQSDVISEAFFIPPASPANKKTWGVLTLNDTMTIIKAEAN